MSPAIKSYAEEKLQKLEKYSRKIIEAHVMFSLERYRNIAEIVLRVNGGDITGRAESTDMYASIDTVVDKLERMLNKRKDKVTRRRQRETIRESGVEGGEAIPAGPESLKVVPLEMTVDDAMEALEKTDDEVLVFVNSATSRTTVLHRRNDGSFTLIEPVK
ncbi:MAG: ribosome-associated translation inhibitor RaiA [Candidatus Eisenbacteria bacterium]|nr:ribosome-associated translation inhibitor RaiA [Candidatus Eisenbacteria bacterium]